MNKELFKKLPRFLKQKPAQDCRECNIYPALLKNHSKTFITYSFYCISCKYESKSHLLKQDAIMQWNFEQASRGIKHG